MGYSQYKCPNCSTQQRFEVDTEKHKKQVEKSPNGLVLYTSIHRCKNGILGACNLRIDNDLNTRGLEYIKLPSVTDQQSTLGIPLAKAKPKSDFPEIRLTEIMKDRKLKLIMSMNHLNMRINIGNVNSLNDPVIDLLHSTNSDIDLYICGSSLGNYQNLKVWLKVFIDLLDGTKPALLGLLIEGLRFIILKNDELPTPEEIKVLRMILHSYFIRIRDLNQGAISSLFRGGSSNFLRSRKNGVKKSEFTTVIQITDMIVANPSQPIMNLIQINPEEFVEVLKILIKLEEAGIIEFEEVA